MDAPIRTLLLVGAAVPLVATGITLLTSVSDNKAPESSARSERLLQAPRPMKQSAVTPARRPATPDPSALPSAAATATTVPSAVAASSKAQKPATPEAYWARLEQLQRTDKRQALDYALQGEDWYPEPAKLAEARRAMVVTLLVDLGQMPEARARTNEFIRRFPNSRYRPLVQGVTGIHPRPRAPPGHQRPHRP